MRGALSRLAVVGAGFFIFANLYAPQPLLPHLERAWRSAAGSAGLGMSTPLLGVVLGSLVWPRLGARAGATLAVGALGVGVIGALGGLASGPVAWAVLRFLQGVFAAAVPGLSFALLPRLFGGRAAAAAGWLVAANTVGGALGRAGAGWLADALGTPAALAWLALPLLLLAWALWPLDARFERREDAYDLRSWPLLVLGAGLLFCNLFVANLLPYRLEAAGYSLAGVGSFYLTYTGGTLGALAAGGLAWRLGPKRTGALALLTALLGTWLLALLPVAGFALLLGGLFGLHALGGAAAGRWGAGVSGAYVSSYYLGGSLAGFAYAGFLERPFTLALLLISLLLALMALLAPAALTSSKAPAS